MSSSEFTISLHGSGASDAKTVGEVLSAVDGLWQAVADEVTGVPGATRLVVAGFSFRCDGCGLVERRIPDDWTKRGADDLCSTCSKQAAEDGEATPATDEEGRR